MGKDTFEEGFERPKSNFMQFGKPGDKIKGKLLNVREVEDVKFGGVQTVYELEAIGGEFHTNADGSKVEIVAGEVYSVGTKKDIIKSAMSKCKVGQSVIFKYTEERESKMGHPAKIIEVLLGPEPDPSSEDGFELPKF